MRWPRLPRRATLVRAWLVAALLTTAAGVLYSAGPAPAGCPAAGAVGDGSGPAPIAADETTASDRPGGADKTIASDRPVAADKAPGPPAQDRRLPVPAGTVGVAISLAEPAALAVLRPGDRVDLLTVPAGPPAPAVDEPARPASERPATLASAVLVLGTTGGPDAESGGLYLALTPKQARRVVGLQTRARFAVVVRG